MRKINLYFIFLVSIFILASWLRLYKLDQTPFGFHQDEVVNAYIGKFILKNGRDVYGQRWPVFYFDKWGDYPPVFPMYLAGLGSLIFGNTVFAARIIIALFGILTIPLFYVFVLNILKNKTAALFSALMLAINPWHIAFSRTATEGIIALFFYLAGLNCLLKNSFLKDWWLKLGLIIFFTLAYLSYPGMRLIIPLTLVVFLLFYYWVKRKKSLFLVLFLVFSLLTTIYISQTNWGKARFNQTSILAQINQQKDYFNQFVYNENSVFIARVFNNKLVYAGRQFFYQFFSYLSPNFLFVKGGKPPWFSFPNSGLFYLSNLFLIGLFFVADFKKNTGFKQYYWLILILLAVSILPASLTSENSPHMHRSIFMIPFILLISTAGYLFFQKNFSKKFAFAFYFFIFLEFIYFFHNYFQHVSMYTAIPRSDGNQKAAVFLSKNKKNYKNIYFYVSGWFPIYYLYFSNNYQPTLIGQIKKGMRVNNLDNIYFINKDCPDEKEGLLKKLKEQDLLIFSSTCSVSKNWLIKRTIRIDNINNTPVYWLYQTKTNYHR